MLLGILGVSHVSVTARISIESEVTKSLMRSSLGYQLLVLTVARRSSAGVLLGKSGLKAGKCDGLKGGAFGFREILTV